MEQSVLFGRYRLIEPAGTGGTAQVWRAIDERGGDTVALKRLHPIVLATAAGRQRLVREFRALRDLRHPNVVKVRDLEMARDDAALILDYVSGPSVRERIAQGPLPVEEAARIAADVAAGLAAAHADGIVHRDVSPGNILLDANGTARLTDFGIARESADETAVTATGTVVGTLRYVSPEQLRGDPATPRSDLFGLAAVTYEMLTGRPAFPATSPVGLAEMQRAGPAPIEGVDPRVDAAVRRALAHDPEQRQPTVEAFAAALLDATAGGSRTVGVAGAGGVAAGAGVAAAAGAAGAAGAVAAGDANPAAGSLGMRPRAVTGAVRSRRSVLPGIAAAAAIALGGLVLAVAAIGGPSGDPGAAANPSVEASEPVKASPTEEAAPQPAREEANEGERDDDEGEEDDDEGEEDDDEGEKKGKKGKKKG